jgi:hypothetical protein
MAVSKLTTGMRAVYPVAAELPRLGFVVDAVLNSQAQQGVPFIVPVPDGEHRRDLGSLPTPH